MRKKKNKTIFKLLCVGNPSWCEDYVNTLNNDKKSTEFIYELECISDFSYVEDRLKANGYDLLLINYNDIKTVVDDPFKYNKLAFAMSRPSILICNSFFSYLKCKFTSITSKWFRKFKFAHNLIRVQLFHNIRYTLKSIKTAKDCHGYIDHISSLIFNTYINE